MPWSLSLYDVDAPYIRARDAGLGHPWPLLGCSIAVNGTVRMHRFGIQTVECRLES